MSEIIDKIDQVLIGLSNLNARFDGIEKKVDVIEDEIRCLRHEASKNSERIIRLEESYKNLNKEVDRSNTKVDTETKRVEISCSDKIHSLQANINQRMDKKLLALKLAIYTSIAAAAFSISQFAFNIWRSLK